MTTKEPQTLLARYQEAARRAYEAMNEFEAGWLELLEWAEREHGEDALVKASRHKFENTSHDRP